MSRATTVTTVPGASKMNDETIYKHLNARHKQDLGLSSDMHYSPLALPSLAATHRAFHRRIHEMATPGMYDHEHINDN